MSIEERLMRDIAAVTRGVTVTEQDLLDAREQVDDIIESKTRRERFMRVAGAAAAAVVVAGVGYAAVQSLSDEETAVPAGPAPVEDPYAHYLNGADPTPELIAGLWRLDNGGVSVIFKEDGTMRFSEEGMVYSQPQAFGTYEIEGDSINMTFAGGVPCEGVQQNMRASLTKQGDLHSVADEASGGDCTPLATYQSSWEHVLPAGQSFTEFKVSNAPGWKPLDGQVLQGDWAAEGGGYVLEMTRDAEKVPHGAYYILDESAEPVDEGRWSLQGNDLVLTSLARSASCSAGDQLVLGNVETTDNPGTPAIRGTVEENACGGAWTPKGWFLIPHDGSGN